MNSRCVFRCLPYSVKDLWAIGLLPVWDDLKGKITHVQRLLLRDPQSHPDVVLNPHFIERVDNDTTSLGPAELVPSIPDNNNMARVRLRHTVLNNVRFIGARRIADTIGEPANQRMSSCNCFRGHIQLQRLR